MRLQSARASKGITDARLLNLARSQAGVSGDLSPSRAAAPEVIPRGPERCLVGRQFDPERPDELPRFDAIVDGPRVSWRTGRALAPRHLRCRRTNSRCVCTEPYCEPCWAIWRTRAFGLAGSTESRRRRREADREIPSASCGMPLANEPSRILRYTPRTTMPRISNRRITPRMTNTQGQGRLTTCPPVRRQLAG